MQTPLFSVSEIRLLEQAAVSQQLSESSLMKRAGNAACSVLLAKWPNAKKILVVCGVGNNGGDGFVLASEAKRLGLTVEICWFGKKNSALEAVEKAFQSCQSLNIPFFYFHSKNYILSLPMNGKIKAIR